MVCTVNGLPKRSHLCVLEGVSTPCKHCPSCMHHREFEPQPMPMVSLESPSKCCSLEASGVP